MTELRRTATVAASREAVWATLTDFGALSGWASTIDHSCLLTEQAEGVGTTRRVQAGRIVLREPVIEWQPPAVLAYRIEGVPFARKVVTRWRLEPHGERTLVTLTTEIDPGAGPGRRLLGRFLARRLAVTAADLLGGLVEHHAVSDEHARTDERR